MDPIKDETSFEKYIAEALVRTKGIGERKTYDLLDDLREAYGIEHEKMLDNEHIKGIYDSADEHGKYRSIIAALSDEDGADIIDFDNLKAEGLNYAELLNDLVKVDGLGKAKVKEELLAIQDRTDGDYIFDDEMEKMLNRVYKRTSKEKKLTEYSNIVDVFKKHNMLKDLSDIQYDCDCPYDTEKKSMELMKTDPIYPAKYERNMNPLVALGKALHDNELKDSAEMNDDTGRQLPVVYNPSPNKHYEEVEEVEEVINKCVKNRELTPAARRLGMHWGMIQKMIKKEDEARDRIGTLNFKKVLGNNFIPMYDEEWEHNGWDQEYERLIKEKELKPRIKTKNEIRASTTEEIFSNSGIDIIA